MGCPSTVSRKPKTAVRPNAKRKGCWTCKRYHRKCDESLPFCQRCVEYGTECEGYGAQRIAFRIHIPQNKQASSSELGGNGILVANRRQSLPRSPSTPSPIITLPSTQQLLLVDFLQGFAATKAISPQHNFYRDDIAPLVGEYPHVRSAALALTTAYKKPGDTAEAFKHYQHAVQAFLTSQGRSNELQANLASIFLLAWFEILVFDPEKWMMHLRGAAMLINRHAKELWQTTFGRRLIHAMARLDCPNSMSDRAPSTLDPQVYELLGRDDNPVEQINSEEYLIDACRRLHSIMGAATCISDEWVATPCPVGTSSVTFRERNTNVLRRLDAWYENLPGALKWKGNVDAMNQQPKLLRVILLQYFATRVHVYHMLDPQRSGLWHDSVDLAKRCLALIKGLGSPNSVDQSHFHGDMSMAFVLAVIGVLIDDDNDRRWIKQYLFSLGRETVWCGYERAMCLEAWWESDTPGKRLIMSRPKRENTSWNWKPEMGMNVDILYEDLKSGELKHDSYFFDRTVAGTVFEDGCTTTM